MTRIKKICSYLSPCKIFADVACDHGYFAEFMLKNELCERAIISDISAKSLKKAENLLAPFIERGVLNAVVCDGLLKVDGADEVIIAGIGGEEIVKILKEGYIPENFVFQPMKNAEVLRSFLIGSGCELSHDDIFEDGKNFYFIIKGKREGESRAYSAAELQFGKDSLKNPVLKMYLDIEISKNREYLKRDMSEKNKLLIEKKIKFMQGVSDGENC